MADVIEDLELIVTRAINYLTRILYDLCRRLNENSHRPLNRRTLVRWLAAFMPTPREPKLRLQTDLATTGPPSLDRWASCGSLGSAFSSASINQMVEEDLGGNIVRYRRGFGDGQNIDEEGFEESAFLPNKLQDFLALTSTPKLNSASSNCSVVSGDTASRGKLMEMEEELAALRKQIAMLVMAQESSTFTKNVTVAEVEHQPRDATLAANVPLPASPVPASLDDLGCEREAVSKKPVLPCISEHATESLFVAPAPPLPTPPVLCKQPPCDNLSLQEQLQQKKRSLSSTIDVAALSRNTHNSRKHIPDMVTVLKDLGSVKLRAVERSPGGTPVKRHIEREPTDPAAIIAQALKKKFSSNWGFSSESDKENDSSSFTSDISSSFGQHTIKKAKKRLNVHDSSDAWTPVASPLKV